MPAVLYTTKEKYEHILSWGENSLEEWYHPVSRSQFTNGLSSVKAGDTLDFSLDGIEKKVQVVEVGNIYDYHLLKHKHGDFHISDLLVERVIRVKLL